MLNFVVSKQALVTQFMELMILKVVIYEELNVFKAIILQMLLTVKFEIRIREN